MKAEKQNVYAWLREKTLLSLQEMSQSMCANNGNDDIYARKEAAEGAARKVLIVNDEDFMRIALRFQLKKLGGVQVFEACGVSDAMRIFEGQRIDVVIADINLGDFTQDGYDLLRHIKERRVATKVYMMSGMQKEDAWPRARELGADGYIQIPYEEEELKKFVMQ